MLWTWGMFRSGDPVEFPEEGVGSEGELLILETRYNQVRDLDRTFGF
jgi:hypothetical protein